MYAQGYNGPYPAIPNSPMPGLVNEGTAQHIMDLERTIKNLRKENYRLIAALYKIREATGEVIDR